MDELAYDDRHDTNVYRIACAWRVRRMVVMGDDSIMDINMLLFAVSLFVLFVVLLITGLRRR